MSGSRTVHLVNGCWFCRGARQVRSRPVMSVFSASIACPICTDQSELHDQVETLIDRD